MDGTKEEDNDLDCTNVGYGRMFPHNLRYGTLTRKLLITNESKRSVRSNFHSSEPPLV